MSLAALDTGASKVFACYPCQEHLNILENLASKNESYARLQIFKGLFPNELSFENNSLGAVLASHVFSFLTPEKMNEGLGKIFHWLTPGGVLFVQFYTTWIAELVSNKNFQDEYKRCIDSGMKWPGYFKKFNRYTDDPDDSADPAFPEDCQMLDVDILVRNLKSTGFEILSSDYVDGKIEGCGKYIL